MPGKEPEQRDAASRRSTHTRALNRWPSERGQVKGSCRAVLALASERRSPGGTDFSVGLKQQVPGRSARCLPCPRPLPSHAPRPSASLLPGQTGASDNSHPGERRGKGSPWGFYYACLCHTKKRCTLAHKGISLGAGGAQASRAQRSHPRVLTLTLGFCSSPLLPFVPL